MGQMYNSRCLPSPPATGGLDTPQEAEGKPEWDFLNRDINEFRAEVPKYEAFDLGIKNAITA